jgi:hypothetical protein
MLRLALRSSRRWLGVVDDDDDDDDDIDFRLFGPPEGY